MDADGGGGCDTGEQIQVQQLSLKFVRADCCSASCENGKGMVHLFTIGGKDKKQQLQSTDTANPFLNFCGLFCFF